MATSYAVLDSGVLLATVQSEPFTEPANALIARLDREATRFVAPTLLRYELVSVARKWVYRKLTTDEEAQHMLNALLRFPISVIMDDALLRRAYELATAFGRPTAYDAQYMAVAERYECDFWTLDERLFSAVKGQFRRVRWLGQTDDQRT